MPGGVEGLYEFNLLHHVGVVAKRVCAAAAAETAHEGDDNTLSGPTGRGVKMISKVSYYLYQVPTPFTAKGLYAPCEIPK